MEMGQLRFLQDQAEVNWVSLRFLGSLGKFFSLKLLKLKYVYESPGIVFKYRFLSVKSGQGQ